MILADHTIWLAAMRLGDVKVAEELSRLLATDEIVGHPFVLGELFMYLRPEALQKYADVRQLPSEEGAAVMRLFRPHLKHLSGDDHGVRWQDLGVIAAAHRASVTLWTLSEDVARLADAVEVSVKK